MRKDNEVWKHEKNWLSDRKLRFLGEEQNPFIFKSSLSYILHLKKEKSSLKYLNFAHVQF